MMYYLIAIPYLTGLITTTRITFVWWYKVDYEKNKKWLERDPAYFKKEMDKERGENIFTSLLSGIFWPIWVPAYLVYTLGIAPLGRLTEWVLFRPPALPPPPNAHEKAEEVLKEGERLSLRPVEETDSLDKLILDNGMVMSSEKRYNTHKPKPRTTYAKYALDSEEYLKRKQAEYEAMRTLRDKHND
jgi:hypothetical protein